MGIVETLNQMAEAMNKSPTPEQKNRLFDLTKDYLKWHSQLMAEKRQERMKDPIFREAFERTLKMRLSDFHFTEEQKKRFPLKPKSS